MGVSSLVVVWFLFFEGFGESSSPKGFADSDGGAQNQEGCRRDSVGDEHVGVVVS